MSVEIANLVHAMATLNLANVPADQILVKGFGIAAVARASTGIFTVTLATPLDALDGIAVIQHAASTSRLVVCEIQTISGAGEDNLQINGYTDAGVAADTGPAYLVVYRYPSIS